MKANDWIRKKGWVEARNLNINSNAIFDSGDGEMIHTDDLKRLVISKAWVDEHGTIERAKEYANSCYTAPEIKERLLQAIADVESCQ